ncbi:helix-turn-helix domain-containing protein [Azospirillum doebereinerae]
MHVSSQLRHDQPARHRHNPGDVLSSLATTMRYGHGQEIYTQDHPAECWYRVVSGAARRFTVQANGRRQIVDFLLPGDFFGFASRNAHLFTVEAIVGGTIVAVYPRERAEALADANPHLGRDIRTVTAAEIGRLQTRILILGRIGSLGKVSAFLLEMAERLSSRPQAGRSGEDILLPMSRYDIADYLTLSVETVSRALTSLKQCGAIRLVGTRRVKIIHYDALEDNDE